MATSKQQTCHAGQVLQQLMCGVCECRADVITAFGPYLHCAQLHCCKEGAMLAHAAAQNAQRECSGIVCQLGLTKLQSHDNCGLVKKASIDLQALQSGTSWLQNCTTWLNFFSHSASRCNCHVLQARHHHPYAASIGHRQVYSSMHAHVWKHQRSTV